PDQHRGGGGASPTQHSPSSHSPSSSTPSTPTRTSASSPPADQVELTGFRIFDLTFIGPEDQWALGIANCLRGPGRCPAMARSTDGVHWPPVPAPPPNVTDRHH